uniref:Adenylate isopentenyltransferase n=1 Tax=Leersia perrieri TaxID=77586 RepID=A0A0D9WWT2_9ORYZ
MTSLSAVATPAISRLVPPPPMSIDMSSPLPSLVGVSRNTAAAKQKAVVVMGATGTGKTRLAVDLALRFGGEVINADKMQLYDGLDVATNKATDAERAGVPHHLIGVVPCPDDAFTAGDFRRHASLAARAVASRGALPVIAGGSNSYIEELVDGDRRAFREVFDVCFLWVDVDCSRGVWRAIGVPELDEYVSACDAGGDGVEEAERARMLDIAVEEIKANTRRLSCRQRAKILRLERMWRVRRVDATEAFRRSGDDADEAWERLVAAPSIDIVRSFLHGDFAATTADRSSVENTTTPAPAASLIPMFALAAAGAGV